MNQAALAARSARRPRRSADVRAALTFITRSDTKPVFHSSALTGGAPQVFFDTERHIVPIRDLRPLAGALSLDHEGFELLRHATAVADLYDDAAVESVYYPGDRGAAARRGSGRAASSSSTRPGVPTAAPARATGTALRGPASRVHVDYTAKSGPQRVKDLLGEAEAARLAAAGARIIQINVWRPIRGPVAALAAGARRCLDACGPRS